MNWTRVLLIGLTALALTFLEVASLSLDPDRLRVGALAGPSRDWKSRLLCPCPRSTSMSMYMSMSTFSS
ncbi:hypothetical protein M5D96_009074 [Drosophila gunungcola]|uniref:Uncharacterized protein n=1 Tax=Drosophila gunungcola TaxID=103775 RepID=A0A9P9YK09_9MUSC|nr:hypothetical protein M5D96_009074 [Drosophila gunungcola]